MNIDANKVIARYREKLSEKEYELVITQEQLEVALEQVCKCDEQPAENE